MLMSASSNSTCPLSRTCHRLLGRVAGPHVVSLAAEELRERLQNDPVLIEDQKPRLMGRVGLEHVWNPPMFRRINVRCFQASAKQRVDGKPQLDFVDGRPVAAETELWDGVRRSRLRPAHFALDPPETDTTNRAIRGSVRRICLCVSEFPRKSNRMNIALQ